MGRAREDTGSAGAEGDLFPTATRVLLIFNIGPALAHVGRIFITGRTHGLSLCPLPTQPSISTALPAHTETIRGLFRSRVRTRCEFSTTLSERVDQ